MENRKQLLPVASAAVTTLFPGSTDSQPRFSGVSWALSSNHEQPNLGQMLTPFQMKKQPYLVMLSRSP